MHLDNLLFLLLVLVAMLFRWLASAASKANKSTQEQRDRRSTTTPPPLPRAPAESDAERIRRFLEALGQPAGAAPPPPAVPRTDVPPRPIMSVKPPREMVAGPLPRGRAVESKKIFVHEKSRSVQRVAPPLPSQPAAFDVQHEAAPQLPTPIKPSLAATRLPNAPTERKIDIAALIASGAGLRDAIVLREILGPPRSLQPLDLTGTA